MLRARVVILILGCAFLVGACGDDDSGDEAAATATPAADAAPICKPAGKPKPKGEGNLPKPKQALDPKKPYVATVTTNCGEFQITLDAKRAPKTGGSFKNLADKGFFDDTTFHRIVAGFVIQGGDPKGDGTGGPGYTVVEKPPGGLQYVKGVVAMAKGGNEPPGASGSQWFVVTAEDAQLPPDYALLGKVTEGQDVVDRIGVVPTTADEQPVDPVVIRSVKVSGP